MGLNLFLEDINSALLFQQRCARRDLSSSATSLRSKTWLGCRRFSPYVRRAARTNKKQPPHDLKSIKLLSRSLFATISLTLGNGQNCSSRARKRRKESYWTIVKQNKMGTQPPSHTLEGGRISYLVVRDHDVKLRHPRLNDAPLPGCSGSLLALAFPACESFTYKTQERRRGAHAGTKKRLGI